jgi:hypothetical protein
MNLNKPWNFIAASEEIYAPKGVIGPEDGGHYIGSAKSTSLGGGPS